MKPIVFWLIFFQFIFSSSSFAECASNRVDLRGKWGKATFFVEVADTPESREKGLMNRQSLPRRNGMLFIYEKPKKVSFWMKNTPIPLDMLFFDERGMLTNIAKNTVPYSTERIRYDDILYVLEINGGLSDVYGITERTEIRHPSLTTNQTVWKCE